MTATELLQLIWASGSDPDDPHADPVGKTKLCLKAIEDYRTEQCRKVLLAGIAAGSKWIAEAPTFTRVGVHEPSTVPEYLTELANDPARLKKLMEEADK